MRKTIFLCLLIAGYYFAPGQEKTLVHSIMLKPKAGQALQFENNMKAHNQKFHGANDKVFVFQIITGEKMGYYQVAWPPTSWAEMDNNKPNPVHDQDVQTKIQSLLQENDGMIFSRRVDSLSHGDNDWTIPKTQVTIWHIKPGKTDEWLARLRKFKLAFDNSNDQRNYTIYTKLMAGSDPQVILISRYRNGWKEMEPGFYTPLKDVLSKAYSAEEWGIHMKAYYDCVEKAETYLRVYRPDLSSK
ncbi:hypothetical protein [Terrimonas alba]|uniref:hypothetical protein n=1 Tax=Terrimonas alba TaxID=3349636 RepID=UPI0035F3D20D